MMEEKSRELKVMMDPFCIRFEIVFSLSYDEMRVGRSNDEDRNAAQNFHSNQLPLYQPFYRLSLLSPLIQLKRGPTTVIHGRAAHPKHHSKCDFSAHYISTTRNENYLIFSRRVFLSVRNNID
jgi:hypothetical protein